MGMLIVAILAGMMPIVPAAFFFVRQGKQTPVQTVRGLVKGLVGFNAVLVLMVIGAGIVWLTWPSTAAAAGVDGQADPYASLANAISTGLSAIGAGISVGGAAIGAGIAVGGTGAAAVGTIAEKPESLGRALIFVGLAEGIAIYGLIISFMVLNR